MWGSQGWNQWALQPAMFNDVPHEQIDWAELAKQWIQMQQTQPSESTPLAPPPLPQVVPPVSLPPPPPPPGHVPLIPEEFPENNVVPPLLKTPVPPPVMPEPFHAESPFENEPVSFVAKTTDNSSFWSKPQWEASVPNDVDERLWAPPPVEPAAPILPGKETFDYGHVHDNPPLAMQSIDYNHMSDFSYNQMYPTPAPAPEAPYDQYWSQVNATPTISPIFLKKERSATSLPVEEESTQIDAAKRKQLPAWIRDGLEKMEQERLKRLERERAVKENAEKMAKRDLLKNNSDFKDGSSTTLAFTRSKFDSDSEEEENETNVNKMVSPVLKRTPSPTEDTRTEEERKEELMLKVRRTLTEILLMVTNTEMVDIAQEMYRKAVSKAPARQLATASSLSSVASGLRGLASYGTESEASDPEEEDGSDSEEELYRKIKEKKRLFAQKEKRIIAELERKEYEEKIEAEREKMNNDKNSEKKSSKDFYIPETLQDPSDNMGDKNDSSNTHMQPSEHNSQVQLFVLPVKTEEIEENNSKPNKIKIEILKPVTENVQSGKKEEYDSSDSEESSSSGTTSESGGKHKKKLHKEAKKSKSELKKSRKDKSSSKHSSRHRRSKSRDSESSEKHRRERSHERKNSSSKKKKKYKRSDSSGSSSSSSHRRKRSSRYESGHSHRERRSRSYDDKDRRRKRSVSSSRVHNKSDSRSSRSHRYSDDKYDRKYKDEKKYYDHRHSPSPSGHSSRLPRKYRSRSLSSESQSSGKKLKKYRNR